MCMLDLGFGPCSSHKSTIRTATSILRWGAWLIIVVVWHPRTVMSEVLPERAMRRLELFRSCSPDNGGLMGVGRAGTLGGVHVAALADLGAYLRRWRDAVLRGHRLRSFMGCGSTAAACVISKLALSEPTSVIIFVLLADNRRL